MTFFAQEIQQQTPLSACSTKTLPNINIFYARSPIKSNYILFEADKMILLFFSFNRPRLRGEKKMGGQNLRADRTNHGKTRPNDEKKPRPRFKRP